MTFTVFVILAIPIYLLMVIALCRFCGMNKYKENSLTDAPDKEQSTTKEP